MQNIRLGFSQSLQTYHVLHFTVTINFLLPLMAHWFLFHIQISSPSYNRSVDLLKIKKQFLLTNAQGAQLLSYVLLHVIIRNSLVYKVWPDHWSGIYYLFSVYMMLPFHIDESLIKGVSIVKFKLFYANKVNC